MIKLAVLKLPSILLLYCALCEPLCQLKYSGNTTNLLQLHLQTMHPPGQSLISLDCWSTCSLAWPDPILCFHYCATLPCRALCNSRCGERVWLHETGPCVEQMNVTLHTVLVLERPFCSWTNGIAIATI